MCDMTVLVIEDNVAMLSAAEAALQGIYRAVLVRTGKSGVDAFRVCRPDAVILDLGLPDLNGLEVLSILKAIDPSVPVIILTAVDDTSVASKAMRGGAFTYLVKPLELRSLVSAIREATDRIPLADGVVLPSATTKDLFRKLADAYSKTDTIVLLGERGVGKQAFSRAVHRLYNGSEQSMLTVNGAFLRSGDIQFQRSNSYSTVCVNTFPTEGPRLLNDLNLRELGRKVIVAVETSPSRMQPEIEIELALSEKWELIAVPPLRLRQNEAFPFLCYWHQRLEPRKLLDSEAAEFYIQRLEAESFPGNVDGIVSLARRLAAT